MDPFNRPGVAGAVLQTPLLLISSLDNLVTLCENIFKTPYYSQTVGARELTFLKSVHTPPHVTCHMTCDRSDSIDSSNRSYI